MKTPLRYFRWIATESEAVALQAQGARPVEGCVAMHHAYHGIFVELDSARDMSVLADLVPLTAIYPPAKRLMEEYEIAASDSEAAAIFAQFQELAKAFWAGTE